MDTNDRRAFGPTQVQNMTNGSGIIPANNKESSVRVVR
jgi:hypothetical protein